MAKAFGYEPPYFWPGNSVESVATSFPLVTSMAATRSALESVTNRYFSSGLSSSAEGGEPAATGLGGWTSVIQRRTLPCERSNSATAEAFHRLQNPRWPSRVATTP